MTKMIGLGVSAALCLLASCGSRQAGGLAAVPSTSLEGQATALVFLSDANLSTDRYITGPDEPFASGPTLTFHTPWQAWRPRQYRVAPGVVMFSLRDGGSRLGGSSRLGFEARPGELYQVRYDPDAGVAVEEVSSGRVARGKMKRLLQYPEAGE